MAKNSSFVFHFITFEFTGKIEKPNSGGQFGNFVKASFINYWFLQRVAKNDEIKINKINDYYKKKCLACQNTIIWKGAMATERGEVKTVYI